jgi:hypothetical protein
MKTGGRNRPPSLVQNLWVVRPDTSGTPIFERLTALLVIRALAVEELFLVGYPGESDDQKMS